MGIHDRPRSFSAGSPPGGKPGPPAEMMGIPGMVDAGGGGPERVSFIRSHQPLPSMGGKCVSWWCDVSMVCISWCVFQWCVFHGVRFMVCCFNGVRFNGVGGK